MNVTYISAGVFLPFGFQGIISPDSRQFYSLWYLLISEIYCLRDSASYNLVLCLVLLQIFISLESLCCKEYKSQTQTISALNIKGDLLT